jgi:hypothetical protein
MSTYFLVKHNTDVFNELTLVKFETVIGNCYLVSDVNDTKKREWLMYYDIYRLIDDRINYDKWMYNDKYDKILKELISKL